MLHIALHIGAILINFVLCLSVVSRFDIDALEKKEHFKNLCKMGLTNQDVKKYLIKKEMDFMLYYGFLQVFIFLSIACTFLISCIELILDCWYCFIFEFVVLMEWLN